VLDSLYCCGTWDGSTCEFGSSEGFKPGLGAWINNRTDGSTGQNQTQIVTVPSSNASDASSSTTSTTNDNLAIGLGVGITLGLLLAASLVYVWYLRRKLGTMRRQIREYSLIDTAHATPTSSRPKQADMTALDGLSHPPPASPQRYEMRRVYQTASPAHHEVRGTPMSELEDPNLLH
jgi:hypothetical protein